MNTEPLSYVEYKVLADWFGCTTAVMQKMVAHNDWNMWRRVEEKVMEEGRLWDKFAQEVWEQGNCKFGGDMMKADLPTRARALYLAFQSLRAS